MLDPSVKSPPPPLPCLLQVIWVDLLTEREFTAGFGSHTPMFTGQVRVATSLLHAQSKARCGSVA